MQTKIGSAEKSSFGNEFHFKDKDIQKGQLKLNKNAIIIANNCKSLIYRYF